MVNEEVFPSFNYNLLISHVLHISIFDIFFQIGKNILFK